MSIRRRLFNLVIPPRNLLERLIEPSLALTVRRPRLLDGFRGGIERLLRLDELLPLGLDGLLERFELFLDRRLFLFEGFELRVGAVGRGAERLEPFSSIGELLLLELDPALSA
jgi:hypothetical protein